MKKVLPLFSVIILLLGSGMAKANDALLQQYLHLQTSPTSSIAAQEAYMWLLTGEVAEPEMVASPLVMCFDTAGTSTRTRNGNPLSMFEIVNYGDILSFQHDLNSNVSGDGDPLTLPGVNVAIYENAPPTVAGPDSAAIYGDPNFTGDLVGTDITGSITFSSDTTYNSFYIASGFSSVYDVPAPPAFWFANMTIDDHANDVVLEGVGTPNECVNVNTNDVWGIVFLNPLDTFSFAHPVGGNLCAGRINLQGGMPHFDASNYTVGIQLTTDATITGTIISTSVTHKGLLEWTVPQPGDYNIIVSDNNGGLDTFTVAMNSCVTCTDDAGTAMTGVLGSSMNPAYLCAGDSLQVTHDGNADVQGDPNPATAPGLGYVMYTCQPTVSGTDLATISSDPCIVNQSGSSAGFDLVMNIDINGNGFIINDGGTYQNILGAPNAVGTLWFAPITIDDHANSSFEGIGTPNECTNVSIGGAFPVVFLNDITLNNVATNQCDGSVDVTGGVPQFDGSFYNVSVVLSTDNSITGTVTSNNVTHGGTVTFTVPQPGLYTVTVTDSLGCGSTSGTNTVQILMNTCPFPCVGVVNSMANVTSNYSGSPISCNGAADGQITVNTIGGTAPLSFNWSHDNTVTDSIASNLGPGSYSITVTDANGCADTVNTTLTEPAVLFVTLDEENPLCNGDSSGLVYVGNIGGGTMPYSYSWSGGTVVPTGDTIINIPAGAYALTVTDANGCMASASTNIGDPPVLLTSITQAVNTDCAASSNGFAVVTPSGGTPTSGADPYSYNWGHDPLLNDSTATGLTVGTYYVTVTDANGCMSPDSVTIGADKTITTDLDSVDVTCYGGSDGMAWVIPNTVGGTPNLPYTFTWSHDNTIDNDTVTNLVAGTYIVTVTDALGCFNVDSIVVNQPDSLDITIQSINNIACFGDTNGAVVLNVIGGTPAYAYLWSTADTTPFLSNLGAGVYTVTVTDANGCQDSLSVPITQADSFYISQVDTVPVACAGDVNGALTVTMMGGQQPFSYVWSRNPAADTTATLANIGAGSYNITVTDASGCQVVETLTLNGPPALTGTMGGQDQSCFDIQDGVAYVVASGGTTPYSYAWNNSISTNDTITGLTAGQYIVTVTDNNGCTYVDSFTVNTPPQITISVTTTPVSCPGGFDGTATATANGGAGGFTYLWDGVQSGQTVNQLSAGQHFVTATDQSGCSITDTFMVAQIPPMVPTNIGTTPVSCFGGADGTAFIAVSGGTAPYTYSWNTTPAQDSSTAINLTAGAYQVIVADANGCTLPPITLTVNQPSQPLTSSIETVNPTCAGEANGSVTAIPQGGTASYTYQWSDPDSQTTQTAINLMAGVYTVTITDANGCQTTAGAALSEPLPLFVQINTSPTSCNGGKDGRISIDTVLGGTPPYSYSIDGANFLPVDVGFFGLFGGNYTVTVQDSLGCIYEEEVLIEEPPLIVVDLGPDLEIDLGDTVQLNAIVNTSDPVTYTWSPMDSTLTCLDCPTPIASPTTTTEYTVMVVDTNGCQTVDDIIIDVNRNRRIFIPNAFTPNGDGRNDRFVIYGGTGVVEIRTFVVYDRWGELMHQATNFQPNDESQGWDGRFRGRLLDPAVFVYYVEVEFADGRVFPYKGDVTLIR